VTSFSKKQKAPLIATSIDHTGYFTPTGPHYFFC
jgi:hypothetical protein